MKGGLQMLTQATISCHRMAELRSLQVNHARAQSQHQNSPITLLRKEQPLELIRYLVREGFVLLVIKIANRMIIRTQKSYI